MKASTSFLSILAVMFFVSTAWAENSESAQERKNTMSASVRKVSFKHKDWDVVGNLHLPENFDENKKYPAIVIGHPIGSCKEQTAGIYAAKLAAKGFVTLAFDASTQGESGGEPRYMEDPAMRVEDFRCAADYLVTVDFIDENRIGVLGICGGGGYAVNAAMTERRFKAVGTVVGASYGRLMREGDFTPDAAIKTLEAIALQRTAEARGGEPQIVPYAPASHEEREKAGLTDIDFVGAVDYYRTPRGQHPGSPNKLRFSSLAPSVGFDPYHLAEHLLTQPLQIIIGNRAGAFGAYRDGYELFDRAASSKKNLYIIQGASHYDLYDIPEYVDQAVEKLNTFYTENM